MKNKNHSGDQNRHLKADLHLHTSESDGLYPAGELVFTARKNGLELISITDHDTVKSLEPARRRAEQLDCGFIPGVELEALATSADGSRHSIHLLGYGIDYRDEELLDYLERLRERRVERARKILARLKHFGVELSLQAVRNQAGGDSVGRVHLAGALKEAGHVRTVEEAFQLYIGDDRPAYVAKTSQPPDQVIDLIHQSGGTAVWAHPYYTGNDKILPGLVEQGLDGIECYHYEFDRETTEHYLDLAEKHDLLITGGSDYHGTLEEDFSPGDWWYEETPDFPNSVNGDR